MAKAMKKAACYSARKKAMRRAMKAMKLEKPRKRRRGAPRPSRRTLEKWAAAEYARDPSYTMDQWRQFVKDQKYRMKDNNWQ